MNICLLTLEWPPHGHGIGTYMFNLARGLSSFGHKIKVITNDKGALRCSGVRIIQVPVPESKRTLRLKIQRWRTEPYHTWSLRAYKEFVQLCKKERFDIVETAEYGALGRYFVGQCDVPVVVKLHCPHRLTWQASNISENGKLRFPLWLRVLDRNERKQTDLADAIVSPSVTLADYLSSSWGISKSRITVLPNPIDSQLFCPRNGEEIERNEILYVGRLQHYKGICCLAKSVKPLLEKYPDLGVRFVGTDIKNKNGDMGSDVIRGLIPQKYHKRINFNSHVPVSNIVSFQRKALCTVVPSRGFEAFSYTVLESMSCGAAVVATHCGGPTEIITHGIDGLLVPPGDTKALTGALERLIQNPQLRKRLALEGRRTVERCFDIPVIVPQIVRLYKDVISNYSKKAL